MLPCGQEASVLMAIVNYSGHAKDLGVADPHYCMHFLMPSALFVPLFKGCEGVASSVGEQAGQAGKHCRRSQRPRPRA